MEKRDEERMDRIIGKVYRGQEYEDRLHGDRLFSCMLNVRLRQLTGVKPSRPTAKPVVPSAAAPAAGAAASGQYVAAQPAAPVAAPRVAANPTNQANSQRVYLNDEASVIAAFARFGVVLTQVPNSKGLLNDKNHFGVYVGDCDAARCKAIQIRTKAKMTPLPSRERIDAWNSGMLYGRAVLGGNFVSYDTVVPIPSTGIDINDLKEVVDIYLANEASFVAEMTKP